MYLVLCHDYDECARWAYRQLLAAGLAPLEIITSSDLAAACRWDHRLGQDGVQLEVELADRRVVRGSEVRGVLNRLMEAPRDIVDRAETADREYAGAEMAAFYLSWIAGLRNPINSPTPMGLCGAFRHVSAWAVLAAQAGFAVPGYRQSHRDRPASGYASMAPAGVQLSTVIVLRGQTYGSSGSPLPHEVARRCRRLAHMSGTDLLGIDLFDSEEGWEFAYATPWPNLIAGGAGLIDGLMQALRGEPT
ncbi:MAG TPA: hypothetical protein VMW56_30390 [Candidatus Margulisiibacteriota bacterium]|nr:hypothetical protein [Candidatus Margulisiibacteriota bacterium]